jgi:hypothetical protein
MKIDGTEFGSITIDGETYPHDVLIRLSSGRRSGDIQRYLPADIFSFQH